MQQDAKPATPLSIRVSHTERAQLARLAGDAGISAYVRQQLFGSVRPRRVTRRPAVETKDIAQILALLGAGELASNLHELARAAEVGALPVLPETEKAIADACMAVIDMRNALIGALGLKERDDDLER